MEAELLTYKMQSSKLVLFFFKKWANPALFFVYFRSFQTKSLIFTRNQREKCHAHPVYGARD